MHIYTYGWGEPGAIKGLAFDEGKGIYFIATRGEAGIWK